ncbi:hypothetical protein NDU88_001513 [Pleurodeles waltl]|uniref:Uncharacterized protein n=1 Tax=Pleurodeles waltl TaxID=8319 RepID=A0AAV7NDM3_PLEWA|nr:hypothetical protein NDU88_001513 [Pleurodeles waltl]
MPGSPCAAVAVTGRPRGLLDTGPKTGNCGSTLGSRGGVLTLVSFPPHDGPDPVGPDLWLPVTDERPWPKRHHRTGATAQAASSDGSINGIEGATLQESKRKAPGWSLKQKPKLGMCGGATR